MFDADGCYLILTVLMLLAITVFALQRIIAKLVYKLFH